MCTSDVCTGAEERTNSRDADGRYNVGVKKRRECRMTARVWLDDSIRSDVTDERTWNERRGREERE